MKKCPNCNSSRFKEVISGENKGDRHCLKCGYVNKKMEHIDNTKDYVVFDKKK